MIDCLSIVETDKVNHAMETDIVKLMVEIESFDISYDKFNKETGLSDGLQPKQEDLSCVHALNELHLHENSCLSQCTHEADPFLCHCLLTLSFSSEIFKPLSFRLDRLCHLAILCLDQHAHTLHHLESLLTISLDRLDIFEGRSCISEFVRKSLSLILELS
ncbi:hypothetical protein Tco_1030809 [Tanacetum coccineum]|uniref:Uncharacterized protein n=1 Tax=Tanacetum coccineum TaxID=301880 RepID=A0ABQ5G8D6_9ASTR